MGLKEQAISQMIGGIIMGISSAQKKESMKISHSHPSIIEIDFLAIKKRLDLLMFTSYNLIINGILYTTLNT